MSGAMPIPGTGRLTVGIVGGMGPAATADFFRRLVDATTAGRDQDHLHVVIDSDPTVPDRTAFLVGDGEDPAPKMLEMALRLEAMGADVLVIPCNTAEAFLPSLRAGVQTRIVSWVEEAVGQLRRGRPVIVRVGLLATTGTVRSRLYHDELSRHGIDVVTPTEEEQDRLMGVIYAIKADSEAAGDLASTLAALAESLLPRGAEAVLLGCTELSLLASRCSLTLTGPLLDASQLVAERMATIAGGRLDDAMAGQPNGG
jgi:aspartate racemase